jgi:hypothetical protein
MCDLLTIIDLAAAAIALRKDTLVAGLLHAFDFVRLGTYRARHYKLAKDQEGNLDAHYRPPSRFSPDPASLLFGGRNNRLLCSGQSLKQMVIRDLRRQPGDRDAGDRRFAHRIILRPLSAAAANCTSPPSQSFSYLQPQPMHLSLLDDYGGEGKFPDYLVVTNDHKNHHPFLKISRIYMGRSFAYRTLVAGLCAIFVRSERRAAARE